MRNVTFRIVATMVLISVVGGLGYLTRHFASLDWLIENESQLRSLIQQNWWLSWATGLILYTVLSLIPGTAGKSVVVGWLFGFWGAVLLVDIGLTVAGVGGFLASRLIVRETISSKFGNLIAKLDRGLEQDGAFYLLMMRMAHVPFSLVNYAAGATSVSWQTFGWTTAVGLLPGTMIFVFVGTRIPTLAEISQRGVWLLLDPMLSALLAGTVVLPLLIRWAAHKFYQQPGTPPAIDLSDLDDPSVFFRREDDANKRGI